MSEEDGSMSMRSRHSSFFKILSSYNSNVLLAALVFLLLVVLFVLLLHFYARFFWSPSHQDISAARRHRRVRRNRRRTVTTTRIIPSIPLDGGVSATAVAATSDDKGLDSSVISSIPLFVYEEDEEDEEEEEEECVICLGLWEVGDFGRKLRNCGHGFHVECIDMWLSSHSTCPLCRSPVLAASGEDNLKTAVNAVEEEEEVRMQLSPAGEDDRRFSLSLAVMDKRGVGDGDGHGDGNGVGEGEVRIEVLDEEINGGASRSDRRSMSMTSSASSSLMRMLSSSSSRLERNKVFPSARPYPETSHITSIQSYRQRQKLNYSLSVREDKVQRTRVITQWETKKRQKLMESVMRLLGFPTRLLHWKEMFKEEPELKIKSLWC